MNFQICSGKPLRIFINLENFLTTSLKLKFFLIFKESLNKNSFKLEINLLPSDKEITLTRTIIIKQQPENFNSTEPVGVIKIRSTRINKDFKLPTAVYVDSEDDCNSYFGVKITLTDSDIYVQYRK